MKCSLGISNFLEVTLWFGKFKMEEYKCAMFLSCTTEFHIMIIHIFGFWENLRLVQINRILYNGKSDRHIVYWQAGPPAGDSGSSPLSHDSRLFSDGPKLAIPSPIWSGPRVALWFQKQLAQASKDQTCAKERSSLWVGGQGYDSSVWVSGGQVYRKDERTEEEAATEGYHRGWEGFRNTKNKDR